MRSTIFIVLFLCVRISFGQEWIDYYHDSTLVVSMPYYHYEREMNGLLLSSAKVEGGVIVVSHMPESPSMQYNIRDTSDLRQAYNIFRDELVKTQRGKLLKSSIVERDRLKWVHFTDRGSVEGIDQVIHNLVVFVNDGMYSLTFFEMGPSSPEKDEVRNKIFLSARIAPGVSNNQISSQIYNLPFSFKNLFTPKFIFGICVGLFIVAVILLVRHKNKMKSLGSRVDEE